MKANNTDLQELAFKYYYGVAAPVYGVAIPILLVLCAICLIANCTIVFAFRWIKDLHPVLKITFSLAVSDFWATLIILVGIIFNSYLPYVAQLDKYPKQNCYMHILEAFRLGAMITSVWHLVLMAVCHYMITVHPLSHRDKLKRSLTIILVLIWTVPPLLFLCIFLSKYHLTFGEPECRADFSKSNSFRGTVFSLVAVSLVITSVVYVKMIHFLRNMHRNRLTSPNECFIRRRTRTMITALLIVGTFLIGWLPSVLWFLITCDTCPYQIADLYVSNPALIYVFGILVNSLIIIKAILNPIVYALRMPDIQGALRAAKRQIVNCVTLRFNFNNRTTRHTQSAAILKEQNQLQNHRLIKDNDRNVPCSSATTRL